MNRVHRIQAFNVDRHDWSLKANCHHPDAGPKGMQPSVGGPHALGKHERTVSALEQLSGVIQRAPNADDFLRQRIGIEEAAGYNIAQPCPPHFFFGKSIRLEIRLEQIQSHCRCKTPPPPERKRGKDGRRVEMARVIGSKYVRRLEMLKVLEAGYRQRQVMLEKRNRDQL